MRLAGKLSKTKGKKVYGYLKEDVKALVRSVVDDIGKDERIAELYDMWYERREEVIRTYTETLPPRVPLSENREFKSVRNAVICAAMDIVRGTMPDTEQLNGEIQAAEPADKEVEKKYLPNFKTTWQLYFWAKDLLDYENDGYSPHKAAWLLEACAKRGNTAAKYRLGKMYLKGDEIEKDIAAALQWLSQAAEDGNEFAEYLLGKTYLKGEDVERDTIKAETYLRRAAGRGNKHAAYTLGKALLDGDVLEQDISEAIRYLKQAADAGFKPAQYVVGKMYYKGEGAEQDLKKALEYLAKAADEYPNAAYLAGKICLTDEEKDIEKALRYFQIAAAGGNDYAEYQLGRLYFFGKDVPRDEETGIAYLKASAAHGNEYAEKLLESIRENRNYFAAVAAARLFQSVLRLFINWPEDESRSRLDRTDKKLRRKIDEKKQAQGLKQE